VGATGSRAVGGQGSLHPGVLEQTALADLGGCARSRRQTRRMKMSRLNPTAAAAEIAEGAAAGVGDQNGRDVLERRRGQACSPMEEPERWRIEVGSPPFCRPSWRCGVESGGTARMPRESSRIPSWRKSVD
jgi:hypothetical protein